MFDNEIAQGIATGKLHPATHKPILEHEQEEHHIVYSQGGAVGRRKKPKPKPKAKTLFAYFNPSQRKKKKKEIPEDEEEEEEVEENNALPIENNSLDRFA